MDAARRTIGLGVLVAVLCACAPRARAQEWFGAATWQFSFPTGDSKDFVESASARGLGIELRKRLFGNTLAGAQVAWNVFHERTDQPYPLDVGAVSGLQDRYLNAFPMMVGLHQQFGGRRATRAFVGINAGGYLLIQTLRIGVAEYEVDAWEWGVAPEAAVAFPLGTGAWFLVDGRYQWSPTPKDLFGRAVDLTYFQLNIGFMWEQ